MKIRSIILVLLVCMALTALSQPDQRQEQWEWYLDEVVSDMFVGRNYFEYYYMPSASEMRQQRDKGEVTYFLNSPDGLNVKKVRNMIDDLMASYDDIKAVCDWQETATTYWKEFRCERNKFRFSVKRKALDDGTYYVSVTETAGHYKTLGKKEKVKDEEPVAAKPEKPVKRDRRKITQEDIEAVDEAISADSVALPVMSASERRKAERERQEALKQEERLAKRRAQEERRAQEKAQKEAEKQQKAEAKKQKEEEKRLKKEEEKLRREQMRKEREQARKEQEAVRKQAAEPAAVESKYHYSDVALWMSEKYDFTQTVDDGRSCSMFSLAVKDTEMAKLAIKNALKGSNARMAVPWRLNNDTQAIETGFTVDDHVLVFTIGKNDDGKITLTITEVSALELEQFKQGLNRQ